MMTREILIAARRRIENEESWGNKESAHPFGSGTDCAVTATNLDGINHRERTAAIRALEA